MISIAESGYDVTEHLTHPGNPGSNVLTRPKGLNRREARSTWIERVDALNELRQDYASAAAMSAVAIR
jgi:hypothetical protein